jgi:hypothetical protein
MDLNSVFIIYFWRSLLNLDKLNLTLPSILTFDLSVVNIYRAKTEVKILFCGDREAAEISNAVLKPYNFVVLPVRFSRLTGNGKKLSSPLVAELRRQTAALGHRTVQCVGWQYRG